MSESLQFTIVYADGEDGWHVAQVKEVPGAVSQGRTRAEAHKNVIDALRLMLSPEPDQTAWQGGPRLGPRLFKRSGRPSGAS